MEECVYWFAVLAAQSEDDFGRPLVSHAHWATTLVVERNVDALRDERRLAVDFARIGPRRRLPWLTFRALVAASIRAIERERGR